MGHPQFVREFVQIPHVTPQEFRFLPRYRFVRRIKSVLESPQIPYLPVWDVKYGVDVRMDVSLQLYPIFRYVHSTQTQRKYVMDFNLRFFHLPMVNNKSPAMLLAGLIISNLD